MNGTSTKKAKKNSGNTTNTTAPSSTKKSAKKQVVNETKQPSNNIKTAVSSPVATKAPTTVNKTTAIPPKHEAEKASSKPEFAPKTAVKRDNVTNATNSTKVQTKAQDNATNVTNSTKVQKKAQDNVTNATNATKAAQAAAKTAAPAAKQVSKKI